MFTAFASQFKLALKIDLDDTLPDKIGVIANKILGGQLPVDMFV